MVEEAVCWGCQIKVKVAHSVSTLVARELEIHSYANQPIYLL